MPSDLENVLSDLGPRIGAAADSLLRSLRDAHHLRGVSSEDLVNLLRDCEAQLARFDKPSNSDR